MSAALSIASSTAVLSASLATPAGRERHRLHRSRSGRGRRRRIGAIVDGGVVDGGVVGAVVGAVVESCVGGVVGDVGEGVGVVLDGGVGGVVGDDGGIWVYLGDVVGVEFRLTMSSELCVSHSPSSLASTMT